MFLKCITEDMAAILGSNVVACLPKGVYLAGGSAVALYFNHRLSDDLDLLAQLATNVHESSRMRTY